MTLRATAPLLLLSLSLGLLTTLAAKAEVRRCETPSGQTVFTDRKCTDIGATQRVPNVAGNTPARMYRGGCARNLQDLAYELTTALDSHDVNRLAGVVDWAGMSGNAAYAVMDRLAVIADRPLVGLTPVYPAEGDGDAGYYPQETVRRAPVALRVEQTLANGSTPSHVVFGLRRYFGCWWLRP